MRLAALVVQPSQNNTIRFKQAEEPQSTHAFCKRHQAFKNTHGGLGAYTIFTIPRVNWTDGLVTCIYIILIDLS